MSDVNTQDLPHIVILVLGDWSDDGHGKTNCTLLKCNLTPEEVETAYKNGVDIVGVDLSAEVANDYQDCRIGRAVWDKFMAAGLGDFGYTEPEVSTFHPGPRNIWVDHDLYLTMYLLTVRCGNPAFKYEILPWYKHRVSIGGYGLFS